MTKIKFSFGFLILTIVLSSCGHLSQRKALFPSGNSDVILEATPFKVKGITSESVVDVVEEGLDQVGFDSAVVSFKIDKVSKGEFTKVKFAGPSKFQQMKDAARDRDFWKIIKSDFSDPNGLVDQKLISVAVQNPVKTFGFNSWSDTGNKRYRLYLQLVPKQINTYVLVKNELKS